MHMTINKLDVAVAQLETALELYFSNGCRISITTLAGAAEEILGRYIEIKDEETALAETVRIVCLLHYKRCGSTPKHAPIKARANFAKNSFKHMNLEDDFDITIDVEEEAIDMLNRAIDNYWKLIQGFTPLMERYEEFRRTGV